MSELVNLEKGQRVDLTKTHPGLVKVNVGLGWDIAGGNAASYDLDAFAFSLTAGKLVDSKKSILFFGNKKCVGMEHGGDNLTGVGDGDDETIKIDLSVLPGDECLIGVNIYQAESKRQNFGQVNNAFVRLYDADTNTELCKYDLTEDYSKFTAVVVGKLYKKDGEWKFQAMGEGKSGDINQLAAPYAN
jgi:tellurium resistance protein TerD